MSALRPGRRAVAWLPIALAVLAPAAIVGAAPAASAGGCVAKDAGNGWLRTQPTFTDLAGAPVTAFASPAFDPNLLWATDGAQIARSDDAGCSWTIAYAVTQPVVGLPLLTGARITAMAAPSSANRSSFLYVGVTATVAGIPRPQIVTTTDRGRTWSGTSSTGQSGLPIVGTVRELTANAQVPQLAYALIDSGIGGVAQPAVYATSDGGGTWVQRTGSNATANDTSLRAHPLQTSTVYGLAGQRLEVSTDGGATFTTIDSIPVAVNGYDIASGSGGARIAAALSDTNAVAISSDDAHTWSAWPAPDRLTSVAAAPLQDLAVGTDGKSTWFLTVTAPSPPIGPKGTQPADLAVTAPTSAGFSVSGLRDGAILRATFSLGGQIQLPPIVDGVVTPVFLLPRGPITQFPSTLTPATKTLRLPVGGRAKVPYQLLLPRTPTPVDVMFLIDTTSSMQPVIDGLRQGLAQIAASLDTSGLDAQFGLGDFQDYPSPYGTGGPGNYPYRLDHRVSIAGPSLATALGDLRATGGTSDGGQSALTALYQSTTGAGDLEQGETFVVPGEDAGYRRDSLRLAMVATDTPPHYGGEAVQTTQGRTVANPGPGYDDVIRALRAHGVHQIGLAIDPGSGQSSRQALTDLARRSDALAPAGGVDCNGDGVIDVPAGGALVCTVGSEGTSAGVVVDGTPVTVGPSGTTTAASMAAAVIGLAANIPDIRPLQFQVSQGAAYASVASGLRAVNLHADNELSYDVDVRCPPKSGGRHQIEVSAATPARTVATAAIDLTCVPAGALTPSFGDSATPLAGVALAPAPPAPAPNPVPNVNPNPNPNPNPAPNPNPNPAMASQEQKQQQLAFANAEGIPRNEEFAMSRLPSRSETAFVCAAAMVLAGASCAIAVRRRTVRAVSRCSK